MSRKISGSSRCCFLISLVLVSCAPALAQHTGSDGLGGTFNTPVGGTITKTIMDRIAQRNQERRLAARRSGANSTARTPGTSPPGSTVPAAKLNESSVLFRPTGTQLKTREIANLIDAGNPQVVKLLTTLLEEFDKGARAAGHPNDLALALSFFFATNASIYHGGGQPPDPPMVELRDTIAEALAEGNTLNGVTDRQKQEMYETLVLFTGFALTVYEEGKQTGNAETIRTSQKLAGQNLLALIGISPDKITFTDQGLNIEREPVAATATATPSSPQPTSPQNAPAATVNAGKLVIDFEGNEVRALQIYGGKRTRVNGTVNSIDILKDGRIALTFHSPAGGYAMTRCYFNKSQSSRLAELKGGQEAIVEGTVRGFGGGFDGKGYVELENCSVPPDQTKGSSNPIPTIQNNDPFPDRPGYAPQKPLSGTLKGTITMADLVGAWDHGAGSVQTYIDSSTGDYSRTATSFYGEQFLIKSDGAFEYKFVGRANNRTVRESDSGNVILSGSYITFKFKGRLTQKYQLIAFMNQPGGAAILSLVGVHDTFQGYDAAGMSLECGHSDGFIRCVGGEEWARLGSGQ